MTLRGFFQPIPRGASTGKWLLGIVATMVIFGTMMMASATEGEAAVGGSPFSLIKMDIIWLGVGLFGMVIMMVMKLDRLLSMAKWIGLALLGLLLSVEVFGTRVDGAKRWIRLQSLVLQPSEFFKLGVVILVAAIVQQRHRVLGNGQRLIVALWPVLAGLGIIAVLQNDLGTSSIVALIALSMMVEAGITLFQFVLTALTGATMFAVYASIKTYAYDRFTSFLHPSQDVAGLGYQLHQSLVGIGAGGITGLGYGQSREKWGLLPNPHTDFIFSIVGEELGLLGTIAVIALFLGFLWVATDIIRRCENDAYRLMAVGITTWIMGEAIINMASTVGLWAITGVPLPFFSYGGSALVMELCAVGLLYNIACQRARSPRLLLGHDAESYFVFSGKVRHSGRPQTTTRSMPQNRQMRSRSS
jgi:cell division protein FtsW